MYYILYRIPYVTQALLIPKEYPQFTRFIHTFHLILIKGCVFIQPSNFIGTKYTKVDLILNMGTLLYF